MNQIISYNYIVDCSNAFHRSYHSYKREVLDFNLDNQEHFDMMVRKFVIDVVSISRLFPLKNIYFCFDDNKYFRRDIYPGYKGKRSPKEKSFTDCMEAIYNLLVYKKLNAIKIDNLEADDCIALVCEMLFDENKIIISMDNDLKQLLDENTFVLTPVLKTRKIFKVSNAKFLSYPNIEIEDNYDTLYCLLEKILKGCDGDDIPGIAPKGFRKTKIEEINKQLAICLQNNAEICFEEALYNSITVFGKIEIDPDVLVKQLFLVCLSSSYIPKENLNLFNKIKFNNIAPMNIGVHHILSNTRYWDKN